MPEKTMPPSHSPENMLFDRFPSKIKFSEQYFFFSVHSICFSLKTTIVNSIIRFTLISVRSISITFLFINIHIDDLIIECWEIFVTFWIWNTKCDIDFSRSTRQSLLVTVYLLGTMSGKQHATCTPYSFTTTEHIFRARMRFTEMHLVLTTQSLDKT